MQPSARRPLKLHSYLRQLSLLHAVQLLGEISIEPSHLILDALELLLVHDGQVWPLVAQVFRTTLLSLQVSALDDTRGIILGVLALLRQLCRLLVIRSQHYQLLRFRAQAANNFLLTSRRHLLSGCLRSRRLLLPRLYLRVHIHLSHARHLSHVLGYAELSGTLLTELGWVIEAAETVAGHISQVSIISG